MICAARQQVFFQRTAGIAPDVFFRHGLSDKPYKMQHDRLIFRLHRFPAKKRQPVYIGRRQSRQNFPLGFRCIWLPIGKAPCFRVEAAFAVSPATGNKQRHADTCTVCNIGLFDGAVIHEKPSYRCSTRSRISCVRPWFQNCVPMYPQVRRATFMVSWSWLPHCGQVQTNLPSCSRISISPSHPHFWQ